MRKMQDKPLDLGELSAQQLAELCGKSIEAVTIDDLVALLEADASKSSKRRFSVLYSALGGIGLGRLVEQLSNVANSIPESKNF